MRNKIAILETRVNNLEKKLAILMDNFEDRLAGQIDNVVAQYEAQALQERSEQLKLMAALEKELAGN